MKILYATKPGSYVRRSGGRIVVTHKEEELASVPLAALESVVLFGPVQISTQAMQTLLGGGISLVMLSSGGRFLGSLSSGLPKNVFVRLAQQESASQNKLALMNAREVVATKTWSQKQALARWRRNHWLHADVSDFTDQMALLEQTRTVNDMQLAEARLAKIYYGYFGRAIPPPFEWQGRTRRPPRDPANALLSLIYMCLVSEAVGACYAVGLDPFVGFLHQLEYGRPSLALDLIEPLRPAWCDHLVLKLLQHEEFSGDDFYYGKTTGCRLQNAGVKKFFQIFAEWVDQGANSPRRTVARLARQTARSVQQKTPFEWQKSLEAG